MTEFSVTWAMPSRWTFQIPPISRFVDRWTDGCKIIVDPFSGKTKRGTINNDLADGGMEAGDFCESLVPQFRDQVDAVLFDPPYSPRQISECYKSIGLKATGKDTQNSTLYMRVRTSLAQILKPGGIALSFGWNSIGFGKDWELLEIMLVRHGGAHNDTICVAQRKPLQLTFDLE